LIRESRPRFAALPLARACALLGINRGSYYRALGQTAANPPGRRSPRQERVALLEAIERTVLAFPGYGYRRVTAQLQREGWVINHKRVLRLMREESLLCQLQRRWIQTTDSVHGLTTYPNLLPETGWRQLSQPDQAWLADITYIRLRAEFVYLAVLLDGFSRRVVGWCLSRSIDAALVLGALEQALAQRQPAAGWIHHSDRGVQYACRDYVERLHGAGAQVSMSGKGRPRENAAAERFFRTLKQEEVYLHDYETYQESEQSIGQFIDAVYNEKRLHSALGYRPPSEFEQLWATGHLQ
jgi:putative transposase